MDVKIDYDKLGRSVAQHLHTECPLGWEPEDIATLHDIAVFWRETRSKAWGTVVVFLVIGVLSLIGYGVLFKLK